MGLYYTSSILRISLCMYLPFLGLAPVTYGSPEETIWDEETRTYAYILCRVLLCRRSKIRDLDNLLAGQTGRFLEPVHRWPGATRMELEDLAII